MMIEHDDSVTCVAFSHDGMYAAIGGLDGIIHVCRSDNGAIVQRLEGPDEVIVRNCPSSSLPCLTYHLMSSS